MKFPAPLNAQAAAPAAFSALLALALHLPVLAQAQQPAQPSALGAAPAAAAACPALLNHSFPRLQDEKPQSLCQYSGKDLSAAIEKALGS